MKRVRISPKDGAGPSNSRARGSRVGSQLLQERSLLLESNDGDNDASVLSQSETRAVLNRARLRSRSTQTEESSASVNNVENIRQSWRRPSRTISNLTSADLQLIGRVDEDRVKSQARVRMVPVHKARKVSTVSGERVDAVMKAPPNMKGGLVVIRSYCRYPPEELRRQFRCRNPATFYYYNVATAKCQALSGVCTSSKNKFPSYESCMESCIVNAKEDILEEWFYTSTLFKEKLVLASTFSQDSGFYCLSLWKRTISAKC